MKLIKNINELARKAQKKTIILVLASIGTLIFVGWIFMHSTASKKASETPGQKERESSTRQGIRMDGTVDSQFTQDASQKALEENIHCHHQK